MARLVLHLDGQVLAEYNMSKERYTIGRLPDNDIRIDNPAVSGHHALVINILSDSFLEDLNSTNGTYVNGKIIKKHALQHGDVLTIGHHALRFVDSEAEETEDEFQKTMVISPRDAAALMAGSPKAAAAMQPAPPPADGYAAAASGVASPSFPNGVLPRAKLQVLSGQFAGRELELVKTLTTLGRPGVQVAAITRRADGFYIVHVESGKEGDYPLVNGAAIGPQARRLHDNDVVQLAGVKMGFFEN
ncbi:MAG: FHA domain-containing protein [Gammaproteobacteria bacterium]|nr:FHA domain-containing protein [Gammaproteobacteria bacterium]MDH5273813.1 FHA domain-containing protein [Gammaproteobacteria bacterium]